jgi:hypothetical protein
VPISLHFARVLTEAEIAEVRCEIVCDGAAVRAVPLSVQGDGNTAVAAPGCFVAVPLDPLPPGKEVTVHWTVPKAVLAKDEVFAAVTFTVAGG